MAGSAFVVAAATAHAEAFYSLDVNAGQVSPFSLGASMSRSGAFPPAPAPLSIASDSGFRATSEFASISGGLNSVSLNAHGSLVQRTPRDDATRFNTLASAEANLELDYWVIMVDPSGTGITSIPIVFHARSTSTASGSEGFTGSEAQIGSSFGVSYDAQKQCSFDISIPGTVCTTLSPDFNVTQTRTVSPYDPFGFFMSVRGVDQADYPGPGSSSYSSSLTFDISIDPTWIYASAFALVAAPPGPGGGGGGSVPTPAPLALLATGLLALTLVRRRAGAA